MSEKSELIHELEWALTLVKYSPKPNYEKVATHISNAQKQLKILNIPVVVGRSEQLVCLCGSRKVKTSTGYECTNNKCIL